MAEIHRKMNDDMNDKPERYNTSKASTDEPPRTWGDVLAERPAWADELDASPAWATTINPTTVGEAS
jgi:hypothetical protein